MDREVLDSFTDHIFRLIEENKMLLEALRHIESIGRDFRRNTRASMMSDIARSSIVKAEGE